MRGQPSRTATIRSLLIAFILAGMASIPAVTAAQDWAPPTTVWIEDSGHTVDQYFLEEWRNYPELLGMPISEELERSVRLDGFPADRRIVQYFEHMAIAYVPEAELREDRVQALPLGQQLLKEDFSSIPRTALERASCGYLNANECSFFSDSEHSLRTGALEFWNANDGERLIGSPLTEEFVARDGYTTQYFDKAVLRWKQGETIVPRSIGREVARLTNINIEPVERPDGVPMFEESLFIPPAVAPDAPEPVVEQPNQTIQPSSEGAVGAAVIGPGPQQGAFKEIVVSISAQTLWAYEGPTLVTQSLVSTGTGEVIETITPLGYYTVLVKHDSQTMEGTISDEYYKVDDVPWVMYFDNLGNAIHGTYWHSNFGTPMSHGCVNLPVGIAEFLYTWAPEGTAVSVIA